MADNVIKTLTIRGVDETKPAVDGLNKTAAAYDNMGRAAAASARVTDTSAKGQLSLADAVSRAERRFNSALRAQQDFEKIQRQMNAAVAQNPALQERANAVLALAAQHFGNVSKTQQAAALAAQDFASRLSGVSGAAGAVGSVLTALGPIGVGLAVTIGGVVLALNAMSEAAHNLAEKAQELRRFSEVTGLTTAQVQALRSEASRFGVTSDEAQTVIQNFTARFNELRLGSGELLTQIRRISPALADQMQMATNAGDALTLFGQALAKVDDVFQRNALVRAASGRGGLSAAAFLQNLNVDALTRSYVEAGKGLDDNLIKKIAQLEIDIKKTSAQASQAIASIFSEPVLEAELRYQKGWLDFATSVKNFSLSGDLRYLLETILKIQIGGKGTLLGALGIDYSAGYKAPPPADTFSQRFQPALDSPLKTMVLPGAANTNKTLEAQVADLKKLIEVLGPAATEAEKLALRQKELTLTARDAGVSTGILGRAQAALNAEFALNRLRETVGALGAAATAAEQLSLREAELAQKVRTGAISRETANRAIKDFANEQALTFLRNNVSALGSAATAAQQYQLRVGELQQQLARGQITQQTFNRAIFEANPLVQELKSNFGDLAKGMVQSMLAGKSFMESLSTGLKALSARLADKAIESLLSGDFAKAAIQGISAVITAVASLLVHTSDLKSTIDVLDRLNQLRLRDVQANADTNTLQGRLAVFNANAVLEQIEEARKGGQLMGALLQVQAEERLAIEKDFAKQQIEIDKQAAADRLSFQKGLDDRLFAATTDTSTLQGALAEEARRFAQERLDAEKNHSLDVNQLVEVQQAEELALRKSFNDKAIEETKRAEQERIDALNQSARSIVDYINGLMGGSGSTLSPTAILTNAQAAYNANYALASVGNLDAQNKFVSLADNFEKALRAVYGSGEPYQTGRQQIINQGLTLPAVAQTTDPVVVELRNVLAAVQLVNGAAEGTKGAVEGNTAETKFWSNLLQNNTYSTFLESLATKTNTVDIKSNTGTTATNVDNLDASGSVLAGINNSATRVVNAINSHGAMSQSAFVNFSDHLAHIRGGTDWVATHVTQGGFVGAGAAQVAGAVGGWSYTAAAQGGTIPAYGLGLVSEHLNPTFLRAGPEPIHVFPGSPSNDNSLVAEVRALREEVRLLRAERAGDGARTRQVIAEKGDQLAGKFDEQNDKLGAQQRQSDRQRKVA